MKKRYFYDILIIGSGISGSICAIQASKSGKKIAIITKSNDFCETNTRYAQGGIIARSPDDDPEILFNDIINAGSGINNREAVRLIANEGPGIVIEHLSNEIGVPFCCDSNGNLDFTQEAAHSKRRIIHVKDETGKAIQEKLYQRVNTIENIDIFTGHTAIDLITNTHNSRDFHEIYKEKICLGAFIFDNRNKIVKTFLAAHTVIATGGVGNLFQHTSNPVSATGDGLSMAYRAGTEIIHAEYIQFHPTLLYHKGRKRFLISETVRGEGAILYNKHQQAFMHKYAKQRELASRDVVARAIYNEMNSTSSEYVYLNLKNLQTAGLSLQKRFPQIYNETQNLGINIDKEQIPVVPGAHYFCGGIKAKINGTTSIQSLYCIGEVACTGLHGANRLASDSLLEGLVMGIKCGDIIKDNKNPDLSDLLKTIPDWTYPRIEEDIDKVLIKQDWKVIQSLMWNYVGIIRSRKSLQRAIADLGYYSHRIVQFYRQARMSKELIELRNGIQAALIIAQSSLKNTKSLGGHFRLD